MTYTKEGINRILNLKGCLGEAIDVFNLYGVLTIGIDNHPGEWEAKQLIYSENLLHIKLEDFANCKNEDEVKQTFNKCLKQSVAAELFNSVDAAPQPSSDKTTPESQYEVVTIQLPKSLLAYVRFRAELNKVTAEHQLQWDLMDLANSDFVDMRASEYLDLREFNRALAQVRGGR